MASEPSPRPPSVERVLAAIRPRVADRDAGAVLAAARRVIDDERARLAVGPGSGAPPRDLPALADAVIEALHGFDGPAGAGLVPVLNATGVILHTNLGRAPWPVAAIEAAARAAGAPVLLEMDQATGRRGARFRAVEEHLIALTGAEDALVVTNNAASLALAVGLAGRGGGVIVSRGELVEIGGGVRIPEILARAGVRVVEVGTTNRTRVADVETALSDARVRVVLRVHPSNFTQAGFVEAPDPRAVAAVAHAHGAIVVAG